MDTIAIPEEFSEEFSEEKNVVETAASRGGAGAGKSKSNFN